MCIDQKKTRIIQRDIIEPKLDVEMHPGHYNQVLDTVVVGLLSIITVVETAVV